MLASLLLHAARRRPHAPSRPRYARARRAAALTLGLGGACTACSAYNYEDPDGPRYSGQYAQADVQLSRELQAATFNVEFAQDIEGAIATLEGNEQLRRSEILLLQEMNGEGTRQIAETLGYDYVYYPASRHQGGDFGNAVLSVWPIVNDAKYIMPHRSPTSGRMRIAVGAVLDTPRGLIGAISVHNDTPWLGPEARLDQARAVQEAARELGVPVVLGGDFNTSDPGAAEATVASFEDAGFTWASRGVGETGGYAGEALFRLDHLFSRDLPALAAGSTSTDASDHRPVWVTLDVSALAVTSLDATPSDATPSDATPSDATPSGAL